MARYVLISEVMYCSCWIKLRHPSRLAALAGALVLWLASSPDALAEPSPDVRVMLSDQAVLLLESELTSRINGQFQFEPIEKKLFGCPIGDDARVKVSGLVANLTLSSLQLKTGSGRLRLQFSVALQGQAHLDAASLTCFGDSMSCGIGAQLSNVPVVIDVVPAVSGDAVQIAKTNVQVEIQKNNISLNLNACGPTGRLISDLYGLFEGYLAKMLKNQLETLAKDQLATWLGSALTSISQYSGDAGNLTYVARPKGVVTANGGIGIDADVNVTAKSTGACPLTGEPTPAPATEATALPFKGEHVGLALSKTMLQETMVEVWRSGMLCLGETEDDSLGVFSAHAPNPPTVELEPAEDARLTVLFPGVQLELKTGNAVSATMDVVARLRIDIDNSSAVLLVDPQVELRNVDVHTEGEPLLDYRAVLPELIPELLAERMRDVALLPRVLARGLGDGLSDYYLYLSRAQTTEQHIMLFALLHARNVNDKTPPSTQFVEEPAAWAKKKVTLVASGTDESTPAPLLRYSWRLDGGSWGEPEDSPRRELELAAGEHVVEVAAVDLSGNIDPQPASSTFRVDPAPPTLELVEGPPDPVTEPRFSVGLRVEDDVTPTDQTKLRVRLERRGEDGELAKNGVWEKVFDGQSTLSLPVLGRGTHTLTVFAEDAAGNRSTPVQAIFESEADAPPPAEAGQVIYTGGCRSATAAKDADRAMACLVGLLLALLSYRRRFQHRLYRGHQSRRDVLSLADRAASWQGRSQG